MPGKETILFLCTGNSCRSQMAQGWTRHIKGDAFAPFSAGITAKGLDPLAVKAMAEKGVDISHHRSRTLDDLEQKTFDVVVTVCGNANENCPFFSGNTTRIHKGFDDPPLLAEDALSEDEKMVHYRRVRDEIEAFVKGFPDSLKS